MKKLFTLSIIGLFFSMSSFAQLQWTTPKDVAIPFFGNTRPIIKLINDSVPMIMWSKASTDEIYVSSMIEEDSFSFPTQVSPNGVKVTNYTWSGPEMDVYGNKVFITFRTDPWATGTPYIVNSADAGVTWSDTIRIDNFDDTQKAYFPMPSAFSEDRLTVTFMHHDGFDNDPQYAYVTSTDGGNTFSDTTGISRQFGAEVCDCCSPAITRNGANQAIIFRNNDNNIREFRGVLSTDSGQTFTTILQIDSSGWAINACPSSAADAVMFDQFIITSFMSNDRVYLSKTDLTTGVRDVNTILTNEPGTENYPKIAGNNDSLFAVWEGFGNGTDLFFNHFKADLSDFDPANVQTLVNDAGSQTKPSVAYALDGTVHIVYMDASTGTVKYLNSRGAAPVIDGVKSTVNAALRVYPNPVTDYLYVSQIVEDVQVYNAFGERISVPWNNNILNVSSLTSGTYFIIAEEKGNRYSIPFTKK